MPKGQVKKPSNTSKTQSHHEDLGKLRFDQDDDNVPDSPHSSLQDEPVVSRGKKRSVDIDEGDQDNFSGEMQKMLDCFGADITKTLVAKRKRLEQYTQTSLKTSNRKIEDVWKNQQTERQKLNEEFGRQVSGVFTQWEADLEKSKEQEEKLQNLFRQQQKLFQQTRVVQSQRLKTIKQLHEQYCKGMKDLENCHTDQQSNVHSELKKEMALLQKRILMDTQQQEMASVRKSLQTMLF